MMFSAGAGADADADAASDDSGAPAAAAGVDKGDGGGGGEEGAKEGAGEAEGEASTPLEENPLEGIEPDDGDPGPPPPLDPSIVTEPSPKASFLSLIDVEVVCGNSRFGSGDAIGVFSGGCQGHSKVWRAQVSFVLCCLRCELHTVW